MLYIYEDTEGQRHEFTQSKCVKEQELDGLSLVGHMAGGKFYSVERGHRVKAVQDPFNIDESRRHIAQLKEWGLYE